MKTLTNESKARFFAQYYGQKVYKDKRYPEEIKTYKLSAYVLNQVGNGHPDFVLELTPLQNISDEHLFELAQHVRPLEIIDSVYIENRGIRNLLIIKSKGNYVGSKITKKIEYLDSVVIYARPFQYLQSKGYTVPVYCPIENRIIPVQEQIDNGWITLKTESVKQFACMDDNQECDKQCSRCKFVEDNLKTE